MIGQFGVVIDKRMRPVQMNGMSPEDLLGLPAVSSYVLSNDMTLHCDPQPAAPVLNGVNGPAVVVLLHCSDLDQRELPLVQGPALITAAGGMTADKVRYLTLALLNPDQTFGIGA